MPQIMMLMPEGGEWRDDRWTCICISSSVPETSVRGRRGQTLLSTRHTKRYFMLRTMESQRYIVNGCVIHSLLPLLLESTTPSAFTHFYYTSIFARALNDFHVKVKGKKYKVGQICE